MANELSVAEAAALLGVHPNTIRRAIRSGELVARIPMGNDPRRLGTTGYRIDVDVLTRWFAGSSTKASDADVE